MTNKMYYRDSLTGNTWKQEKDGWYLFKEETGRYYYASRTRPQNCVLKCFYVQHSEDKPPEIEVNNTKEIVTKPEGLKFDTGKPMVGSILQIFPRALLAVGNCVLKGREKYPDIDNWQYVENGVSRYRDALIRHLIKYSMGIEIDKESKQPHLAHVAWNALAILELYLKEHQEIVDEYIK